MFPDKYTMPLLFTAAENGITGNGRGIALLWTTSFLADMAPWRWFETWAMRCEGVGIGSI